MIMKKMNKGFSMVELIIVIAIMAILAGALAPALIKYINKSRLSTDIQTANTIATGVNTALSSETDYDNIANGTYGVADLQGASDAFKETVGTGTVAGKAKKCLAKSGASELDGAFQVTIDKEANTVTVDISGHRLYPSAEKCLTDSVASCQAGQEAANDGN